MEKKLCERCKQPGNFTENRKICTGCRHTDRALADGTMRPPDFEAVNVSGYKEPMRRVEDGHGYYGAITTTNDGKHIQCHICGYYVGRLSSHVRTKHKIGPEEYKVTYGLRIKDGLLSPLERFKQQITYNKYARKSPEEFKRMSELAVKAKKDNDVESGGDQWRAQTRNERGLCRDQTIAKIRKVAEMCGGVPTSPVYKETFGGLDVVNHWFGTWMQGVEAAGCTTTVEAKKLSDAALRERILEQFNEFYEREGRTPQTSDLAAKSNTLPTLKQVQRIFHTFNNARAEAGVPTLVYARGRWVEVPVGEENINAVVPSMARRLA